MLENHIHRSHGVAAVPDAPTDGRQLVLALQTLLAERQRLVMRLRQAAARGDAATADLAEGLAHLTTRHDALLDRLARAVPPAGAPYRSTLPAA